VTVSWQGPNSTLTRYKAIRPVSARRQRENRERRAMAQDRFPDMNPRCIVPWCTRPADALNERLSRARGGSITDPGNTDPMCNIHNEELTREPDWGYELGLIKHSTLCCRGRDVCAQYEHAGVTS
jgi:hypothetical protein